MSIYIITDIILDRISSRSLYSIADSIFDFRGEVSGNGDQKFQLYFFRFTFSRELLDRNWISATELQECTTAGLLVYNFPKYVVWFARYSLDL